MSDDILERLESYMGDLDMRGINLHDDAADEISRLRARVAHLERDITPAEVEAAAEAVCDAWGYEWNGEPGDDQTPCDDNHNEDERPSRRLYRDAARAALAAALEIRMRAAK